jgi:hypothetical protein
MANFATLANLLAGCIIQVTPDACSRLFAAATDPYGNVSTEPVLTEHLAPRLLKDAMPPDRMKAAGTP